MATTFHGFPMDRRGEGGPALTAAFTSSVVGALFSVIMITPSWRRLRGESVPAPSPRET